MAGIETIQARFRLIENKRFYARATEIFLVGTFFITSEDGKYSYGRGNANGIPDNCKMAREYRVKTNILNSDHQPGDNIINVEISKI